MEINAVPAMFQGSEHTALDASIHRDPLSIRGVETECGGA